MVDIPLNRNWNLGPQFDGGGFGRIHHGIADDGTEVVIKLIPNDPGAARELLFVDLSGLPNVIPIFDSGEWNDDLVLVMPKAEKSLRALIEEHGDAILPEDTIPILLDIVTALVAFGDTVVHRDLKPENVLLYDGKWCLTDFGIARYAEATTAPDTMKFSLSRPYAAPEQWRMERATRQADVYAFGIIAFEMLAGRRPFNGPDEDFREQHLNEVAPEVPNCPNTLQSLVAECLLKAPLARPTPENLLARLQGVLQPTTPARELLRQASRSAVEQQAQLDAEASAAQTEANIRDELYQAAEQSFERIFRNLAASILENAPAATHGGSDGQHLLLKDADLTVAPIAKTKVGNSSRYDAPFDIIAHSSIQLSIPRDRFGHEGRAHSIWYCDAQEEGVYRWFETAFMISPLVARESRLNPFAFEPGEFAYGALSGVMTEFQVAWPFTAIDQGQDQEFIEEWIERFAQAANGTLRHPNRMPERPPQNTWRK